MEGSYDDLEKYAKPRIGYGESVMKESLIWVQEILGELTKISPDDKAKGKCHTSVFKCRS